MMRNRLMGCLLPAMLAGVMGVFSALAADVTSKEAAQAATRWCRETGSSGFGLSGGVVETRRETFDGVGFYVVRFEGGTVVLSSDTTRRPVIFAFPGTDFRVVAENPAVKLLVADLKRTPSEQAAAKNEAAWRKLSSTGPSLMTAGLSVADIRVAGLVTTHWSQDGDLMQRPCYNYYTPKRRVFTAAATEEDKAAPINYDATEEESRTGAFYTGPWGVVCGCTSLAIAQVMNYFEFPANYPAAFSRDIPVCNVIGTGDREHFLNLSLVNAGQPIPWNLMLDEPGKEQFVSGYPTTTEANREAIGALCYNIGVMGAVNLYGWEGTEGKDVAQTIRAFGYSNVEEFYLGDDDPEKYAAMTRAIRANLNAKRPVYAEIPGHSIVCDGYGYANEGNSSQAGDTLYLRLNLGWAWSDHLWYSMPGTGEENSAVFGIAGNIYTNPTDAGKVILSGRVTQNGAAVDGATVSILASANPDAAAATVTTDAKGIWSALVQPGNYCVSAAQSGKIAPANYVTVASGISGDIADCDLALAAGAVEVAPIPASYTRLDWVRSDGTQYINTNVDSGGGKVFLFADNAGGAPTGFRSETIRGTKLVEDVAGVVRRVLVPCRDNNGVNGFWDLMTGAFFASATTSPLMGRAPGETLDMPSDYTALEYIASTGEQYINTRYVLQAADKIECVVNVQQGQLANPNVALYGTSFSWAYGCRTFLVKQNGNAVCSYDIVPWEGSYGNYVSGEGFYGRKVSITDVNGQLTWTALDDSGCSGSAASLYGNPSAAFNSLLIFDHNVIADYNDTVSNAGQDGNWASAVAKLYSFTITDANGYKVRDYVPCQKPDGTIGLWDKVDAEFVTSATSAAFHSPLPAGYEEVEFIRSTPGGCQYINTGHCPTDKTRIVATVYEPKQEGATGGLWYCQECDFVAMFGSFTNGGPDTRDGNGSFLAYNSCAYLLKWWSNAGIQAYIRYAVLQSWTDGIQSDYGNLPAHSTKRTYDLHPTGIRIDGGDWWFWNGAEWVPTFNAPPAFTSVYPLYVFGANQDGTFKYPAVMKLYGFKIYEGDVLARDFVPCRNAKGEVGLYDFVGKQFYGNANPAADAVPFYTTAEDVLPAGYEAVDFIESDGTQYIDTEYMWNYYTRVVCDMSAPKQPNGVQADGSLSRVAFGSYNGSFATGPERQYTFYLQWWNQNWCSRYSRYGWGDYDSYAKQREDFPYGQRVTIDCYVADNTTTAMVTPYGQQSGGLEYRTNFDVEGEWASATCPFYVFAANASGTPANMAVGMKLYGFKIYEGETLMRDYVPCKKPDGTAGLWDKVRGAFVSSPVGNAFAAPYGSDTLPEGYAPAEYIESTGSQYIDTGYYHNADTRIECTLLANQQSGSAFVAAFGSHRNYAESYEYWGYDFYLKWWGNVGETGYTRSGTYNYEDGKFASNWNFPFGQQVTISCDNTGAVVTPGNVTYPITGWNDASNRPFYIFAACCGGDNGQADGPECFSAMKLYGFKIYEGATLKRDLVPCRDPNGVLGLFDMVYGKFYSSPNGVPFNGPSVTELPEGFTALDYIMSTPGGNQYINTLYNHNANTRIECTLLAERPNAPDNGFIAAFGSHCNSITSWAYGGYDFYLKWWGDGTQTGHTRDGLTEVRRNDSAYAASTVFPFGQKATISCDANGATVTPGTATYPIETGKIAERGGEWVSASGLPMYIFGACEGDGTLGGAAVMALYGFKIYDGETLVVDFVPCRNPQGVAGLFDLKRGAFFLNANTADGAVPFVGSDEIVYRSWVKSDGTFYVDTGYVPQANTKVDCVINFDLEANADKSHAAVFGVTAANGYDACTFFRWNGNNNPLYVRGGGENSKTGFQYFYDRKINLVCDGPSAAWTVLEGTDAGRSESVSYVQGTPGAVQPGRNLYIFGYNEGNAMPGGHIRSVMTLYSFGLSEGTTAKRQFFAAMDVNGRVAGVVDALTGDFLPFSGSGTPAFGGLTYQLKNNTMLLRSGTMEPGDADGQGTMTYSAFEKITADSVNVAILPATVPALAVRGGELSFADEATKTYSVTGALTLEGGTTLTLEANLATGAVDAFTVGSLAVNATAEDPVVLNIVSLGGEQVVGNQSLTVISGGVQPGDEAKFALTGVGGVITVENGALVITKKNVPVAMEATWTNGSGDMFWANPANWDPAAVPTVNAIFGLAGTQQTINAEPFFIGSVIHTAEAGAFTHGGEGLLTVNTSIVNGSTESQTFNMPLRLGAETSDFTVNATGNVTLNGNVTLDSPTLVKTGDGKLTLKESLLFTDAAVDVQGGAVEFTATDALLVPSADITVAEGASATINAGSRDLTFAGTVANAGTVTVNGSGTVSFGTGISGAGTFNLTGGLAHFTADGFVPTFDTLGASVAIEYDRDVTIGGSFDDIVGKAGAAQKQVYLTGTVAPDAGRITLVGATWNAYDLFIGGWSYGALTIGSGSAVTVSNALLAGYDVGGGAKDLTVGEGGTLNAPNGVSIGNNGWEKQGDKQARDTFTVDGGTVNAANGRIVLGNNQPHADLVLNAGTLTTKGIQFYDNSQQADLQAFVNPDASFTQRGGTLNLGADGFTLTTFTPVFEPYCMMRNAKPFADLVSGTLTAAADFSTPSGGFTSVFGAEDDPYGAYTVDLNGKTVNWNTGLGGKSDVTLQGEGKFNSIKEFKGMPTGKWTVNANADLSGAAAFAGGLELGADVNVDIDIGTDAMVEMLYQGVDESGNIANIKAYAANGKFPYVVNSLDRLHQQTAAGEYDWSNFLYRGQFYVPADATYYFGANFKGNPWVGDSGYCSAFLIIDGAQVLCTWYEGNGVQTGNVALSAGWHDFSVFVFIDGDNDGPQLEDWKAANMGLGWTTTDPGDNASAAESYQKFDASTLKMRAGAPAMARWERRNGYDESKLFADEFESDANGMLGSLKLLGTADNAELIALAQNGNARLTGSFYAEADGEYMFCGVFDDRMVVRIDGDEVLRTVAYNEEEYGSVELTAGWHTFDIRFGDYGGAVGAEDALLVMLPNEEIVPFDEENFQFRLLNDVKPGLSGEVALGAGSTLNNMADGVCRINGTLTGTGALTGKFAFTDMGTLGATVGKKVATTADLNGVTNDDVVKNLRKIGLVVSERPVQTLYPLCPAGTLTAEEAAEITVTATAAEGLGGFRVDGWTATVMNGQLVLHNPRPSGLAFIIR